jgi:hypothetical protein
MTMVLSDSISGSRTNGTESTLMINSQLLEVVFTSPENQEMVLTGYHF